MYNKQLLMSEMKRQGLSEKKLADLTGLHPSTISDFFDVERQNGGRTVYLIAKALGLPVKCRGRKAANGGTVMIYDLTAVLV